MSTHNLLGIFLVESVHRDSNNELLFHTINSYGQSNQPNPVKKLKELASIHYISAVLVPTIYVYTSGEAAEYYGSRMGLYEESGTYNDYPFYKQLHNLQDGEGKYCWRHWNGWKVVSKLGEGGGLKNTTLGDRPTNNGEWVYWDWYENNYHIDPGLKVQQGVPQLCKAITISCTGSSSSEVPSNIIGRYLPTLDMSYGKQVFKLEGEEDVFLFHSDSVLWSVKTELSSSARSLLISGCAASCCPADSRNTHREREDYKQKSWMYRNTKGEWIEDGSINVCCDTH